VLLFSFSRFYSYRCCSWCDRVCHHCSRRSYFHSLQTVSQSLIFIF